ncbi:MAG: PDZ domain-containing protein [Acidobacteriales bacterium]|nr:PDZ domain-containing protein [Candidatus Koribacter versatilis]MBI3645207.1 PDZ domain-containing protein [Terriglobales bacterium]
MTHRILLGVVLLTLVATAQPAELAYDRPGENWNWGYGVEEGGGGSSYLGVDIADVTTERLGALKLKEEHGAEVTMVDQDAPAGKAGLKEHDVILSLNGAAVESAAQLRRMIRETPAGRVVTLGISRDGQPQSIKVQLANRGKAFALRSMPQDFKFEMPAMPVIADLDIPVSVVIAHSSLRSGLMVENITPQLGEFFGVKNGNGVLVRSVEKGSRSEKAGFHAGDVIVRVNSQSVHDTSDFTRALRATSGGTAAVTVIRDKKEQNLNLTLPDKKDSGGLLMEESFDIPELTAETEVELSRVGEEIARIAPALERVQRATPCLKDLQRKLQDSQRKIQQQGEKLHHEVAGEWAEI